MWGYNIVFIVSTFNYSICSGYISLLSEFGACPYPIHCALAKKINDDPIIINMVQSRSNAWEVLAKVFNISLEIQIKLRKIVRMIISGV